MLEAGTKILQSVLFSFLQNYQEQLRAKLLEIKSRNLAPVLEQTIVKRIMQGVKPTF